MNTVLICILVLNELRVVDDCSVVEIENQAVSVGEKVQYRTSNENFDNFYFCSGIMDSTEIIACKIENVLCGWDPGLNKLDIDPVLEKHAGIYSYKYRPGKVFAAFLIVVDADTFQPPILPKGLYIGQEVLLKSSVIYSKTPELGIKLLISFFTATKKFESNCTTRHINMRHETICIAVLKLDMSLNDTLLWTRVVFKYSDTWKNTKRFDNQATNVPEFNLVDSKDIVISSISTATTAGDRQDETKFTTSETAFVVHGKETKKASRSTESTFVRSNTDSTETDKTRLSTEKSLESVVIGLSVLIIAVFSTIIIFVLCYCRLRCRRATVGSGDPNVANNINNEQREETIHQEYTTLKSRAQKLRRRALRFCSLPTDYLGHWLGLNRDNMRQIIQQNHTGDNVVNSISATASGNSSFRS